MDLSRRFPRAGVSCRAGSRNPWQGRHRQDFLQRLDPRLIDLVRTARADYNVPESILPKRPRVRKLYP